MHYIDEGRGEPIVFVHGNPTWSFEFRHLILGLHDSYRCIAMDHIGFGLSSCSDSDKDYHPRAHAENLHGLMDKLGLENITLFLTDWGGPIGLNFARRRQRIDHDQSDHAPLPPRPGHAVRAQREHLTQAEPHEFPRRGHLIAEEAPEETIELTRAFIEKH